MPVGVAVFATTHFPLHRGKFSTWGVRLGAHSCSCVPSANVFDYIRLHILQLLALVPRLWCTYVHPLPFFSTEVCVSNRRLLPRKSQRSRHPRCLGFKHCTRYPRPGIGCVFVYSPTGPSANPAPNVFDRLSCCRRTRDDRDREASLRTPSYEDNLRIRASGTHLACAWH